MSQKLYLSKLTPNAESLPFEKHYTSVELAKLWHVDATAVRRLLRDLPGVLKITRTKRSHRTYSTIRVPESIVAQVRVKIDEGISDERT